MAAPGPGTEVAGEGVAVAILGLLEDDVAENEVGIGASVWGAARANAGVEGLDPTCCGCTLIGVCSGDAPGVCMGVCSLLANICGWEAIAGADSCPCLASNCGVGM